MKKFLKRIFKSVVFNTKKIKEYKGLSELEIEEAIPYAIVQENNKQEQKLDIHTVYPENWKPNKVWTLQDRIESTGRKFDFDLKK